MANAIEPPVWSEGAGPRVLIEAPEWSQRAHLSRLLGEAGYRTATCAGPEGSNGLCPLLMGQPCPTAAGADLIVHLLRHSDPRNRHVLVSLQRRHSDVPLVVCAPEPTVESHPQDFEGAVVIHPPLSSRMVVDAVERALGGRSGSAPNQVSPR